MLLALVLLSSQNDDSVFIANMEALETVSGLLQVSRETLKLALTYRRTRAGKGLEYFTTPYKLDEVNVPICVAYSTHFFCPFTQAIITRDSLAKGLYGALFDWIVDKVCLCIYVCVCTCAYMCMYICVYVLVRICVHCMCA